MTEGPRVMVGVLDLY